MTLNGKTILVTGAAGFTGSHLSRELVKQGAGVKAYVKRGSSLHNISDILNKVQLIKGDILDMPSLLSAMKNVDLVFHVAAIVPVQESRDLPYLSTQVNTVGTFNVAWTAAQTGVSKMLYTSTCHVYVSQPDSALPTNESAIPNPLDIYSATKYAGEVMLKHFINEGVMDVIITRAFNKYGPNQVGSWLFPQIIRKALTMDKFTAGNPDNTRDYSYIDDIIEGYIAVMDKGKNGDIFNLASGKEHTVKQIVEKIVEASGRKVTVEWEKAFRKVDIPRSYGDYSKAKKVLGWQPKTSLDEGISKTVEWWKQHPELLK
ncbi:MAG TPA: GDP-mannose 4,6-dehydratase [archaeon]|nr:GDP-mannose 4,6-dehydratase [archaeon]